VPRKKSLELTMKHHEPLSPRRYYEVRVDAIEHEPRSQIRFDLRIIHDPNQEGRVIAHTLPVNLTPGSSLAAFLEDAFRVNLRPGESVDLEALMARRFQAKFDSTEKGRPPQVIKVRHSDNTATERADVPTNTTDSTVSPTARGAHGLAENH